MSKSCDGEKIGLEILTDFHIFSPSESKKVMFGMLSVWMCTSLVHKWLEGFYSYLVSEGSTIIGHFIMNILALLVVCSIPLYTDLMTPVPEFQQII
jgi:hypothetical protein